MSNLKLQAICGIVKTMMPPVTKNHLEIIANLQEPRAKVALDILAAFREKVPDEAKGLVRDVGIFFVIGLEKEQHVRDDFDKVMKQLVEIYQEQANVPANR